MWKINLKKERNIFYSEKIRTVFYQRFLVIFFLAMLIGTYGVYEYFLFSIHIPGESMVPNVVPGNTLWFKSLSLESESNLEFFISRGDLIAINKPDTPGPSIWRKVFDIPVFLLTLGWVKLNHREVVIRRLLAYPGDKLEIKNKVIYINNRAFMPEWIIKYQDAEIFPSWVTQRDNLEARYIDENHIFVLNDSWDQVNDSRLFGEVKIENIEGVLIYIYP